MNNKKIQELEKKIARLESIIQLCKQYKEQVISSNVYNKNQLIGYYNTSINSISSSILDYRRKLLKIKSEPKVKANFIAIVLIALIVGTGVFAFAGPSITGFVVFDNYNNYKKIQEDDTFDVVIDSSKIEDGNLVIRFHHNSVTSKPVTIIGEVDYDLSTDFADRNEEIILTVYNYNNQYFKLKVGDHTEVVEFGNKSPEPSRFGIIEEPNQTETIEFGANQTEELEFGTGETNQTEVVEIGTNETNRTEEIEFGLLDDELEALRQRIKSKRNSERIDLQRLTKVRETFELDVEFDEEGLGILGTGTKGKIDIKGIENISEIAYIQTGVLADSEIAKGEITTEVIAIGPIDIESAEIILAKSGEVNTIIECDNWNPEEFICDGEWQEISNSFTDNGDSITFTVNKFSAYGGAIIEIIKAVHLDSNREFISDIFDEVYQLDEIWSEPINNNQYVRVTFEVPLDSSKDITIYPRNTQGANTKVEVYLKNSNDKITEFPIITEEEYYTIYLWGMEGSHDTFDLKIVNTDGDSEAYLEFDHIIDPTYIDRRMPNTFDDINDADFCANDANGYSYNGVYVYCDTDLSASFNPTYWWNNTDVLAEYSSNTINNATFGVYLNCTDNGAGANPWNVSYGFASTPNDCSSVPKWYILANLAQDSCAFSFKWAKAENLTPVTWTNINNTCWMVQGDKIGGGGDEELYIDAFHVTINYTQTPDTDDPYIYINTPIDRNSTISASNITINGTASDSNPDEIFANDSRFDWNQTYNDWSIYNNTPLSDGFYSLNISANDTGEYINTTWINFTLDNTVPYVYVDYINNTEISNGWLNITGTASDPHNDTVYTNDSNFVTMTGSYGSWNFTNTSLLANGHYSIKISANDTLNNTNTTIINFSYTTPVDSTSPIIIWEDPTLSDGDSTSNNWTYLNTTITDASNTSAFFDWNRTLVGYWSFDYTTATHVLDNSTYDNHGAFTGAGFGEGDIITAKYGDGLDFTGDPDCLITTTWMPELDGATEFTVEFWVNPDQLPFPAYAGMVARGTNLQRVPWIYGTLDAGTLYIHFETVENEAGDGLLQTDGTLTQDAWSHVVYTWNGSLVTSYINAVPGTTTDTTVGRTLATSDASLRIGCYNVGGASSNYLNGQLDEVRMYKRALSPEEINASYNNGVYRLENNFTSLSDATYNYSACAIDIVGNMNCTSERNITVDTIPDTDDPYIYINTPIDRNSTISASNITINGTASDSNPDEIFANDSRFDWNQTYNDWSIYNNTPLSDGFYSLNISANDTGGYINTTWINFTLDNTVPGLYVTYPANNTGISNGWLNITGAASDAHPDSVYTNDTNFVTMTGSYGTWNFTNTSPLSGGHYSIKISANDTLNNTNTTIINFTFTTSKSITISLSSNLTAGAIWNITSLPIIGANSTGNNNSGPTYHNISISATGTDVDVYIRANNNLTSSEGYYILLPNETFANSTILRNASDSIRTSISTTFQLIASNLADGANIYLKFFLNVSASQSPGSYNNSLEIKAVEYGAAP